MNPTCIQAATSNACRETNLRQQRQVGVSCLYQVREVPLRSRSRPEFERRQRRHAQRNIQMCPPERGWRQRASILPPGTIVFAPNGFAGRDCRERTGGRKFPRHAWPHSRDTRAATGPRAARAVPAARIRRASAAFQLEYRGARRRDCASHPEVLSAAVAEHAGTKWPN